MFFQNILQITKLLGPFPREFDEGECAEEFSEFIGRPFSRYQRIENLRNRLNECADTKFLLLVERMLNYLPGEFNLTYLCELLKK